MASGSNFASGWVKGHEIDGFDSSLWRRDDFGMPMKYGEYGNRDSEHGWEKDYEPITAKSVG